MTLTKTNDGTVETSVIRTPTWRDNKAVLWLVRAGFVLQFYIPMVVCCWIVYSTGTRSPFTMSKDDPNFADHAFVEYLNQEFFKFGIYTLIFLVIQWAIFALILRFAKLRVANEVLVWLIVINVIHGFAWMLVMWPVTLIRLTPPSILFGIAICVESRASSNVPHAPSQPDTP